MKAFKLITPLLLLLLFQAGSLSAEPPRILLINTDASVEKYRSAQTEFKNNMLHPVKEVNLAEKKWKIREIEDFFYDEVADLIYCIGTKAYLVTNRFAGEKNIVFSSVINWQRLPITQMTYGVSNELHSEMQMMLFKYIFPEIKNIGVLYSNKYNEQWFKNTREQGKEMKLDVIGHEVPESDIVVSSLKEMIGNIDVLWLISDPMVVSDKNVLKNVFAVCDAEKVPVLSYHDVFSSWGAALIVSVDNPTLGRQAAGIAQNVISGTQLKEKVQFPAGSHIILNLKKIKEYDFDYNEDALGAVNQIIE